MVRLKNRLLAGALGGVAVFAHASDAAEPRPVPASARFRPLNSPGPTFAANPTRQVVRQVGYAEPANDLRPMSSPSLRTSDVTILPVQGITLPGDNGALVQPPSGIAPQPSLTLPSTSPSPSTLPPTSNPLNGRVDVLPPTSPVPQTSPTIVQPAPSGNLNAVPYPANPVPQTRLPQTQAPLNATPAQTLPLTPTQAMPNPNGLSWQPPYATIENSRFVTAPLQPTSAQMWGCEHYIQPTGYTTVPVTTTPYVPPPAVVVPPTLGPAPTPVYPQENAGYRPLFTLGQENYNVQLGRGIIGQPTAYVPGQSIRNFLRYLFP